jgi:hypothetical protein
MFSGTLVTVYTASSRGPLKWDLEFTPAVSGHYSLLYSWFNLTSTIGLDSLSKEFHASSGIENYTLSWSDIPSSLNSTANILPGEFLLSTDLVLSGLED